MSAASCLVSEDRFLCSICLDVFTDPVTTPCGHNFCKKCITKHWNTSDACQCALCNEVFTTRPDLRVNTLFSEMVSQFGESVQRKAGSSSRQHESEPGEVPYDVCTATRLKALMVDVQIQKRRLKILEIKRSMELSERDADRAIAEGAQVFTDLKESVERKLNKLVSTMKEKQRATKKRVEDSIKEVQQEISELMKRSTEVEQLSRSGDHRHLLQSSRTLNAAPPTRNWTGVRGSPPPHGGTEVRALPQLEETFSEKMEKLFDAELERVQRCCSGRDS